MFASVDSFKQPTLREESGYASAESSQESLPEVYFAKPHLKFINAQLQKLEPQGMWQRFVLGKLRGLTGIRYSPMVHYISAWTVPDYRLWTYWPRHCGHAFEA